MEPLTVHVELRPRPFSTLPVSHSRFFEEAMAVNRAAVVCRFARQANSRNDDA